MLEMDASAGAILLLGAVHGINPAMGWLFAVSLGMQEGRSSAAWRALGPLAVGHALAIGATLLVASVLGLVVPIEVLRWMTAVALLCFGVRGLVRHTHPRLGGMRVGARELTGWSFLMASAHGAGLMVLPFVLRSHAPAAHHSAMHAGHAAAMDGATLLATLLHTAGYLVVAGAIAWVVCAKVGLRVLRTAWINMNLVWAIALIATALLTLVV